MKSIFTVFQDIEKLIYKIMMWIILIPKTIVQIVLYPSWAPDYVKSELGEGESHFDEYISPVILLLVAALLPALAYSSLPSFGTLVSSSAETKPTTDRFLSFEAQADFVSASTKLEHDFTWEVWKKNIDGGFDFISSEFHSTGDEISSIASVDNNTVNDRFLYTFDSGEYFVHVFADKVDPRQSGGLVLESYDAFITIVVPVDTAEQVIVSSARDNTSEAKAVDEKNQIQDAKSFGKRLKDEEETVFFLALALMIPPLLFAFATKIFLVKEIGENTLKENFYIQCYYFSPLSLAIWGTYYAFYFFTEDAFLYQGFGLNLQIILLPLILCVLWFLRTEVKNIAGERNTTTAKAIVIAIVCITILGLGGNVVYSFPDYQDMFRLWAIRIYPIAAILLILGFVRAWYKRRQEKKQDIIGWNGAGLVVGVVLLFGAMKLISNFVEITSAAPAVVESQSTATSVVASTATPEIILTQNFEATPTLVVGQSTQTVILETPTLVSSPFYAEEFNGDLASWFDFMSSGDQRMVQQAVELGKLSVRLLKLEDRLPWYYLINNAFAYADVKVEAIVTNRGNNANGVSLICRYSDIGWYEFVVSNDGTYNIYAVDSAGIVNQGYNSIASGGSPIIKTGQTSNVYTIVCAGNDLSLLVNQKLVRTITDKYFKFAEGKIGLAVSSPKKLPVNVEIETFTVSAP